MENYVSDALWRGRIWNSVLSHRSQSIDNRDWAGGVRGLGLGTAVMFLN